LSLRDDALMAEGHSPQPGAFTFEAEGKGLLYACPCGCGAIGYLPFRGVVGNEDHPSWIWDGSREAPTLQPSVLRGADCRWHGWLRAGVWVTA